MIFDVNNIERQNIFVDIPYEVKLKQEDLYMMEISEKNVNKLLKSGVSLDIPCSVSFDL